MKIIFHGAAREVGKSCIEIQSASQRYLLDAGVKFVGEGLQYPQYLQDIRNIDAVFLSHAHLDHSGALAFLEHKRLDAPIYATPMTWAITRLLLEDERHLEQIRNLHPDFGEKDVRRVGQDISYVAYDHDYRTKDGRVRFQYLNSGHIPGGASIVLELEGKKVLYTADMNTATSRLMEPATYHQRRIAVDTLIVEGTYGVRDHPQRAMVEDGFLKSIESGLRDGGSVLIPVFGVGRSQEILLALEPFASRAPIYLDGMARDMLDTVLGTQDPYVRDRKRLQYIAHRVQNVQRHERAEIAHRKGVIIVSTSGMVQGGPSSFYARQFIGKKENYILLTGYQAEGTQGRRMFEDHIFIENGEHLPVKCHMRKFDFSAHVDRSGMHEFLRLVDHKNLILQHGDANALDALSQFAREHLSSRVFMPQLGEVIEV